MQTRDVTTTPQAQHNFSLINLRRVLILRSLLILGWTVTVLGSWLLLHLPVPLSPLLLVISIWMTCNAVSWRRLRQLHREVTESEFLLQILLDAAILTILLFLTGGATNPFTLLLLLPLIVAAAVLSEKLSWLVAAIMVLCYSLLLVADLPLQIPDGNEQDDFDLHVVGMWSGFVFSALLIAAFVVKMGSTLRERDKALAMAREQALRDERVLALGALAAGTAHELATPLGTIAIMAKELEEECADSSSRDRLRLLQSQVTRCKQALSVLSASAGQNQAQAGYKLPLDRYLHQVVQTWQTLRPSAEIRCDWPETRTEPVIVAEQTLTQALISILNNAADASPHAVELEAKWDSSQLMLKICDRGSGLAPAASTRAGQEPFSTKSDGLGLGLYLAHGVITRLGGNMRLFNRHGGGVCVRLELPLARLLVNGD